MIVLCFSQANNSKKKLIRSCTSLVYKNFRWNYEPELVGEDCWNEVSEVYKLRSEILVSSREIGNVTRFINHICLANVMWQPVGFEKDGQPLVRIAFLQRGIYLRWQSWGMIMECLMILERLMKMEAWFLEVKGIAYVVRETIVVLLSEVEFLIIIVLVFFIFLLLFWLLWSCVSF